MVMVLGPHWLQKKKKKVGLQDTAYISICSLPTKRLVSSSLALGAEREAEFHVGDLRGVLFAYEHLHEVHPCRRYELG